MGMSVEDYINHAKAEHSSEVNEEKQMKKDIKKQQLYHETMYGASLIICYDLILYVTDVF